MNLPKITVLIFVRNGERFISKAFESIVCQNYPNLEVIVIDGKSTDHTLDILKRYSGYISLLVSEADKGIYHALNKGLLLATGNYICFLAADDYFYAGAFQSAGEYLASHPEADLLYGNADHTNEHGTVLKSHGAIPYEKNVLCNVRDYIPAQAVFIKREALSLTGIFDTQLKYCGDWDLWKRFAKWDLNIQFLNRTLGAWTLHSSAITGAGGTSKQFLQQGLESFRNTRKYKTRWITKIEVILFFYILIGFFRLREPLRYCKNQIKKIVSA